MIDPESLVTRRSSSVVGRALEGAGRLLVNSLPYATPFLANAVERGRQYDSGLDSPQKRMRSRSRSVSRGRSRTRAMSISRSRSRSRSRYRSSSIVSRQHDQAGGYRARFGRTRRARRYRRFRYRVLNTVLNEQPLQIYTAKGASNETTAVNQLGVYGMGLYLTSYTGSTDLATIASDAGITTSTTNQKGMRVYIKSACMDVEIKNNLTTQIVMDVYEVINRKDVGSTSDIETQWSNFYAQQATIGSADPLDPANSLFENATFCQHYKIIRKREVLIPGGEIVTMQMRMSKDRTIQVDTILDYVNAIPKVSRFYIFSWHGPPETSGGVSRIAATDVTFAWQKSYKWGVPPTPKAQPGVRNA